MSIPSTLRTIVEETSTRGVRLFDLAVASLIVISLVTFAIDTLPGLSPQATAALGVTETAIVLLFTGEYLLRLWVSRSRRAFATSFYGIIDLIAIVPFYVATGLDLRSVRAFRLLRIFRILKLSRYSAAISRLGAALRLAREELVLYLSGSAIVLYVASVGFYYFENAAQPEHVGSDLAGLWSAVATHCLRAISGPTEPGNLRLD